MRCIKVLLAVTCAAGLLPCGSPLRAIDWPGWRGADRTDVSTEKGLLKSWPAEGPKQVWLYRNAGKGYSGPSVVKGVLYTLGTRGDYEILVALDASTGKELWTSNLGSILGNKWGDGPRGTPSVAGDNVYAMGGKGDLVCVKAKDGSVVWKKTMRELGGKVPNWGYTESVLVDGNRVVCTPGGSEGAMAALDASTGALLWQSKDFTDDAHYSSIIPVDHNGARQYIQLTSKSIVGIGASEGKTLWKSGWHGTVAVIPTPIFAEGHVYVTSGYRAGCKLVKVGANNEVTVIYDQNKVMQNHHGGVIYLNGHIYGHSDNPGPGWVCQDFKTGEQVWASKNLGKGAVACVDGMLYCLEENSGTVALVEASPKGWNEKGRFKLSPQTSIRSPDGRIWTHPVVSGGKLFLRDQDLIYCYDVRGNAKN